MTSPQHNQGSTMQTEGKSGRDLHSEGRKASRWPLAVALVAWLAWVGFLAGMALRA